MWPFSHLKPEIPEGVSHDEAIATGIVPPPGYQPPGRAGVRDAFRILSVAGGLLARHVRRLLVRGEAVLLSSQDAEGQDAIRSFATSTLAEAVPHHLTSGSPRVWVGGERKTGLLTMAAVIKQNAGANNNIETYYPRQMIVPKSASPTIYPTVSDERQEDPIVDAIELPSDWTQELEDEFDAETPEDPL